MNRHITDLDMVLYAGIAIALALLLCTGCATSVKGGSARTESRGGETRTETIGGQERSETVGGATAREGQQFTLRLTADGMTITSDRAFAFDKQPSVKIASTQPTQRTATTQPYEINETVQPSASSFAAMPKIGGADAGELGGVSFKQISGTIRSNWGLFAIFGVLAVASWYVFRSIGWAAFFGGLALLAAVYPTLLMWLAFGGVVFFLVLNWQTIKELVQGGEHAIAADPRMKETMERAHTSRTKATVRAAKGK